MSLTIIILFLGRMSKFSDSIFGCCPVEFSSHKYFPLSFTKFSCFKCKIVSGRGCEIHAWMRELPFTILGFVIQSFLYIRTSYLGTEAERFFFDFFLRRS